MTRDPAVPHDPHRQGEPHLAHHFADLAGQAHAARVGMWVFLGSELLLFGPLFAGYATYRALYFGAFSACSHHLDRALGTVDTFILISSSFAMAMALHFCRSLRPRAAIGGLLVTMAFGLAFLVVHAHEYLGDIAAGALPGRLYHGEVVLPGAGLFYTLYYFMTGLHSIHVMIGLGLMGWLLWRTHRGDFSPAWDTPFELGALYWHLIDLIWLFLYPLLYLI
jgi:cytochrome c oxidase subunit 3